MAMRRLLTAAAVCTAVTAGCLVGAAGFAAADPQPQGSREVRVAYVDDPTPNPFVITGNFVKNSGGVDIYYRCLARSGPSVLELSQVGEVGDPFLRSFRANCDGRVHAVQNIGAPSRTSLVASLNNDTGVSGAISVYVDR